jgi:hypothetical protein
MWRLIGQNGVVFSRFKELLDNAGGVDGLTANINVEIGSNHSGMRPVAMAS